jgi:hypothetical protein
MDPLLDQYYTPLLPAEPFPHRPPYVQDALTQENAAVLAELEKADQHHTDRVAVTKKRVDSGGDSEYFFCVVFVSKEQRDAFLDATTWAAFADETRQYVNGIVLSQQLGIPLPEGYLAGVPLSR